MINDLRHANGRTGMGAVMGSKNLKAIAVRGTNQMTFAEPAKVKEIAKWLSERIQSDSTTHSSTKWEPLLCWRSITCSAFCRQETSGKEYLRGQKKYQRKL